VHSDVALLLHESFVNNFAETLIGGATLTEMDVRTQLTRLTGVKDDAAVPSEGEIVAITFAEQQPITLQMDDDVISLTIRGKRFIVRNRSYPPMNVTLRYAAKQAGVGYEFTLVGDPQIVPPRFTSTGPNRYSARESALRRILSNRCQRDLPKAVAEERLTLPKAFGNIETLLVGKLVVDDGWLRVNLNLPEPSAPLPSETVPAQLATR
jgi:hypothetical protein